MGCRSVFVSRLSNLIGVLLPSKSVLNPKVERMVHFACQSGLLENKTSHAIHNQNSITSSSVCAKSKSVIGIQQRNHNFISPFSNSFDEFFASFQDIVDELVNQESLPLLMVKRLDSVLRYNILGGKMVRALLVITAAKTFMNESMNKQELKLAHVLGWSVELLQGFFLVQDDIMDNSYTRRGKPCWFRVPDVGLNAINDALLLESCIYQLLKNHFKDMDCYTELLEDFHEITQKTVWGQSLDMAGFVNGKPHLDVFRLDYYLSVVENKTAFYTFCLPVRLAMRLVSSINGEKIDEEHYTKAMELCLKLGTLFQIQDDFLDVYGDPDVTGKHGTDIRDGKCSWLAVTALQNCDQEGRSLMATKYGVDDSSAVKEIMQLYESLSIKEKFYRTQDNMHSEILSLISKLDDQFLKKNFFVDVLNNIYKRKK